MHPGVGLPAVAIHNPTGLDAAEGHFEGSTTGVAEGAPIRKPAEFGSARCNAVALVALGIGQTNPHVAYDERWNRKISGIRGILRVCCQIMYNLSL